MGEVRWRDWLVIFQILANMFRMYGLILIIPALFSFFYKEYFFAKLFFVMALFFGGTFSIIKHFLKAEECSLKDAIISLALGWISISLVSAIPFLFTGMSFVNSFFEAFSGWTGSGLTMVQNPQNLPHVLNFWRSFIQWVGGFGIVILAILLYERPRTAKALFLAEGRVENFFVDILKVGRLIVLIYLVYTLIGTFLMFFSGVPFFDAIVHSLTSISTGGFSSNSVGVGAYGLFPMIITIFLMLMGGVSFMSHYELIKGRIKSFFHNPEIRFMFWVILFAFLFIALEVFITRQHNYFDSLFYTISAITGTGATTDVSISTFPAITMLIFILLMISGASYGSTTGAIKIWRLLIVVKIIRRQILRVFLPEHAVMPIKIGEATVSDEEALKAVSYIFLYLTVMFAGAIVFMFFGFQLTESIFTVASAQGNVGLNIIPAEQYFTMNPILKLQLTFHMLLGRMEIIPFLVFLRSFRIVKKA